MLLSTLLPALAFTGTALAKPLADITDIKFVLDAYNVINTNIAKQQAAVNALTPSSDAKAALTEIAKYSAATEKALEDVTAEINKKSGKLSASAAGQLGPGSFQVTQNTIRLMQSMVEKKDSFFKAGLQKPIADDLKRMKSLTEGFVKAASDRIPASYLELADRAFQASLKSLQDGIDAYSK